MTTEPTPAPNTSFTQKPIESPPAEAAPLVVAPAPSWFKKSDYVLLLLVLALSFCVASFVAVNSDIWLHMAIGQRLSDRTFQFGVDPFSWATEAQYNDGTPTYWVHQSWLYSWLFFQLYHLVGGVWLVLGKAILFTLAIACLSRIGWTESNRWFIIICLTMAVLAVSPRLVLQPMVVSLVFLSITLYVLDRAGVFSLVNAESKPACARCLWWLPPLFALWANLDAWFILGPLVLALCWAASGVAKWTKGASPMPGKMIGLVLAVGLAACLLNPFHVYVFQLPPELAYIVVSLTDSLNIPVPDALVAGGRTLKALHLADPADVSTLWPFSDRYFGERGIGRHVAGMAFYPLLLLGLVSFTLAAMVRPRPGAPTLQVSRFVVWLVFAIMAGALYRMIPFFALVAAPLTAMTLGEFLHWQQVSNQVTAAQQDRGMHLARFVGFLLLALLLYLAWPGWLHVWGDYPYNADRRVAWDIRADPSKRQAAETLQELKKAGECHNVFNIGPESAHYCAWFAPEVKCFVDSRYGLYANQAAEYGKARLALLEAKQPDDWQPLFKKHHVDQVILGGFVQGLTRPNTIRKPSLGALFLNTAQWRVRYGDGRDMVFSLAPSDHPWPEMTNINDWNRDAFGFVPEDQRPPLHGTAPPKEPSAWSMYAEGIPRAPSGATEAKLCNLRFVLAASALNDLGPEITLVGAYWAAPAIFGVPGGGIAAAPQLLSRAYVRPSFRPAERGPPALLILMQRAARRAVAENPLDVQSRIALIDANEAVRRSQEDYWVNLDPSRRSASGILRDRLRQTQILTDLTILVQLPTLTPPDAFRYHEALANLYIQQNLFDFSLDHFQYGLKSLQDWKSHGKNVPKEIDQVIKQQKEKVDAVQSRVLARLARWKDIAEGKPPIVQAHLALQGDYVELQGEKPRKSPMGLGKKALEILAAIPPDKLKEGEHLPVLIAQMELLLQSGNADRVIEVLRDEKIRERLGPLPVANFQILAGGAFGDFAMLDEGAATFEKQFRVEAQIVLKMLPEGILVGTLLSPEKTVLGAVATQTVNWFDRLQEKQKDRCNIMTLRGIAALESGDTKKARDIFTAIVTTTNPEFRFPERPIAAHYRQLLNAQWAK